MDSNEAIKIKKKLDRYNAITSMLAVSSLFNKEKPFVVAFRNNGELRITFDSDNGREQYVVIESELAKSFLRSVITTLINEQVSALKSEIEQL